MSHVLTARDIFSFGTEFHIYDVHVDHVVAEPDHNAVNCYEVTHVKK